MLLTNVQNKNLILTNFLCINQAFKEHSMADALAPKAEEGRDILR